MESKGVGKMSKSRFGKPKPKRVRTEGCDSSGVSFMLKTHGCEESKSILSKMMRCGT